MQIPVKELKNWVRHDAVLQRLILRYAHALFTQVVQTAACNRFHITEQRLCRWLLLARDRMDSNTLAFTQETLAQMLGTDRASITRAAQGLRRQGLLEYHRGKTSILDPKGLESVSCECYDVIKTGYEGLLGI
jgi:CRP-like cAMP-binding protein